jgi:hypothetical protein
MPGFGNTIPYGNTNRMNNWWLYLADWDAANKAGLGLYDSNQCQMTLSTSNITATVYKRNFQVTVNGPANCRWIATTPNFDWITFDGESTSANGNRVVNIKILPSLGKTIRSGKVIIGGATIKITQ